MMHVKSPEVLTVESLRKYLDDMEACWTEEEAMYLGEFKQQKINVPYFNNENKFLGYGEAAIHYNGGLDFIVQQK